MRTAPTVILREALRRGRRVSWRRWPRVLRAAVLLVGVESGLRTVRLPRLSRWLGVPLVESADPVARGVPPESLKLAPRERRHIEEARRLLDVPGLDGTCLRQSLLVGHALRAHRPRLVLGVAKRDGVVSAHAWVEVQGWVVDDFRLQRHAAGHFTRMEGTASS